MKILRYRHIGSKEWLRKDIVSEKDETFLRNLIAIDEFEYELYQMTQTRILGQIKTQDYLHVDTSQK